MIRLTLVRHGETTGQSSVRYYGATDVPLSDLGRAQMRDVGAALAGNRFEAVVSSRLRRAREAAALIAGSEVTVTPIAAFDEVNFGNWEGWTREEIAARDAENFHAWQRAGQVFCYPGGESRVAFHTRVADGLHQLLATWRAGHLLLVLHKGVIASILTELLTLTPPERAALGIDLASIHVVHRQESSWEAVHLNRTDHLRNASAVSNER